jgi:glycosyltransferase involved in cell wall biosynthesis
MTTGAISAILPLHQGRAHVAEAIRSVARQTLRPAELIVVDDGSNDGGVEEVEKLLVVEAAAIGFPVRVVRQECRGQSAARNRGALEAEGDLLAFLDQDDLWHPEHLADLAGALEADPAAGWAYSDFDEIDLAGRLVTVSFLREHGIQHPKRTLAACIASDLMVLPSASVLRRSAFDEVGGFDERLRGYEDDDLYVRMFRSGWRMAFVDRSLTRFRVHGSSSSAGGTFAESRLLYAAKLRAQIEDDRRLNRYWFRDVVAPRFLEASLDDYVRAISDRDWPDAESALRAIEHFAAFRRSDPVSSLKLLVLRNPRRFRRLLQANQLLPPSLRPARSPVFRLR